MKNRKEKLQRIFSVSRKEFLHIIRDKRSFAIVLIMPVIMLVLYGYAINFDIRNIDCSVVNYDNTALSRQLVQKITASGYFIINPETENNLQRSIEYMRTGKITLVMVIPSDFNKRIKKNQKAVLQVLADGMDSTTTSIAVSYCLQIISEFSRDIVLEQVKLRGFNPDQMPVVESVPRVWYNPELSSSHFIIPGLIAIIMMLMSALLTSATIVREKEDGTFEQIISTPISSLEFLAGKVLPYILIDLFVVAVTIVVGLLLFKLVFQGNLATLAFFSFLFIACALGLGLLVSSVAKNQQTAIISAVFMTMIPSILLSGFVFPIDSMPLPVQLITYIIPTRYFLTVLRTLFLKGTGLAALWGQALYLVAFGTFFFFISIKKFRKVLE